MKRQLPLCFVVLLAVPQLRAQECRALVETPAGLAITDATGRTIDIVVPGAKGPMVAAFAPGGRVIAYSPSHAARNIVLVGLDGTVISETSIEPPSVTAIMRLGWAGPRRLWYEGHTGPHLGAMELWDLPRSLDLAGRRVALSAYGHSCAISPDAGAVACLGQLPGSGKRFVIVQQRAGSADPEEVYPDLPLEAWSFDGTPAWSEGRVAVPVKTERDRWLLTLERGSNGWRTEHRPLPPVELQRARPERLSVGTTVVPVLDWFCAAK